MADSPRMLEQRIDDPIAWTAETLLPNDGLVEIDTACLAEIRAVAALLRDNPLPEHIRYYSVVTYPDPETRMSLGLRGSYKKLGELQDARNDSQVVYYDQVIPGSTLLAFPNADHWAMAVPVARQHDFAAATFVNRNEYPREVFFESVIRYIEEDLAN